MNQLFDKNIFTTENSDSDSGSVIFLKEKKTEHESCLKSKIEKRRTLSKQSENVKKESSSDISVQESSAIKKRKRYVREKISSSSSTSSEDLRISSSKKRKRAKMMDFLDLEAVEDSPSEEELSEASISKIYIKKN